jgi:hypothetical protein
MYNILSISSAIVFWMPGSFRMSRFHVECLPDFLPPLAYQPQGSPIWKTYMKVLAMWMLYYLPQASPRPSTWNRPWGSPSRKACEGSIWRASQIFYVPWPTGLGVLQAERPSMWDVLLYFMIRGFVKLTCISCDEEKFILSLNLRWRTTTYGTRTNLPKNWTTLRHCVLKSFNILVKRSKRLGCTNRIHQPHPLFQKGCLAPHSPKKQFLYAH